MDGKDATIVVKTVQANKWNKPGSQVWYWTITTEDNTSEPTKFIQDVSKNAPEPATGKEFKGKMWGNKFYPDTPNAPKPFNKSGGANNAARAKQDADKQADIKAEWAIGKAISAMQVYPLDDEALASVEKLAVKLYGMVDRVKVSNLSFTPKLQPMSDDDAEAISLYQTAAGAGL